MESAMLVQARGGFSSISPGPATLFLSPPPPPPPASSSPCGCRLSDEGDGREQQPVEAEIEADEAEEKGTRTGSCAIVEEMGAVFRQGSEKESLRVRKLIQEHFRLNGAARVRALPPEQYCRQGFVIGKATRAGFGNEMYKILTAGALSIMLNRSLIIGKNRHAHSSSVDFPPILLSLGSFPFGDYLSYSNTSFTLDEVKRLWSKNKCTKRYGRPLTVRIDHFLKPAESNVLCSDWTLWKQPVIWFEGTTDAIGAQFFLKNIHPGMKNRALNLFGDPGAVQSRPNVFGELMRALVSPSRPIEEAVRWVLLDRKDVDVTLHARMMSGRYCNELVCKGNTGGSNVHQKSLVGSSATECKARVVLVSDTPSFIRDISPGVKEFGEIIHFDHKAFEISVPNASFRLAFRARDWGPSPRWVAFVDFFLASRAKRAVISGAHRRIGTTYAQLIAALAAANQLDEEASTPSGFSFFSSIHSNLLERGLGSQAGWGHVWNRFAGPLSCHRQRHQCAATPLMPPAWWDGRWQSPLSRDVRRLRAYGVHLTEAGEVIESSLRGHCRHRKEVVRTFPILHI
ncbi:unnamed protein product [Spirodela intermedia]|uniref:Uncharacterized protein n=1 Tax=Spirodela intermedia TaxID=51605 RepID=A0A7I8IPV5_SPIIN|nr:unnamed protein product [Spirodela intermedia]CAA6659997.1 unnamed protein product [Spirodela intermedia]